MSAPMTEEQLFQQDIARWGDEGGNCGVPPPRVNLAKLRGDDPDDEGDPPDLYPPLPQAA